MIHKWEALIDYMGFSKETLLRLIKLYGFPKPGLTESGNRKDGSVWSKVEVDQWVKDNQPIINQLIKVHNRRSGFKALVHLDPSLR